MANRIKQYNKTASLYKEKLRKKGYLLRFNWVDYPGTEYDDVTVIGHGEFNTPRKAYECLTR
jgi:hypothetical protein